MSDVRVVRVESDSRDGTAVWQIEVMRYWGPILASTPSAADIPADVRDAVRAWLDSVGADLPGVPHA